MEDCDISLINFWENQAKELLISAVWDCNCYLYYWSESLLHLFENVQNNWREKVWNAIFFPSIIFTLKQDKHLGATFEICIKQLL